METKELPPPYTEGFNNQIYGQPSPYAHQTPPLVTSPPQPHASTTSTTTSVTVGTGAIAGGCPVCHNRSWTGSYSCCAWLLCFFCFPCGIICCLCMRKKKCTKCGFSIG